MLKEAADVFNYLIEEPSCLRKRLASSIIILYCCLNSWTENNCPGYSRVTVYSFCAVLHHAQIVSFWIFFGMVFHARMIDVANIRSKIMACNMYCIVIYIILVLKRASDAYGEYRVGLSQA